MEQTEVRDDQSPDPEVETAEDDHEPAGPIGGLQLISAILEEPTEELHIVAAVNPGAKRAAVVAAVAAVLALVVVLIVRSGDGPSAKRSAGPANPSSASWATPAAHPQSATFEVADGAAMIRLSTADLGTDLYRVSAPGAEPQVTQRNGTFRLSVADTTGQVQIALAADVGWDLRIGSGVNLSTIDLSGARLRAVDLTGGADQIDLTLPRPQGTLVVRMIGGVGRLDVHTAQHVPVRVLLGSGAGRVVLDGLSHSGVAAGTRFAGDGWAATADRIDVNAVAGMTALTVAAY